MCRQRDQQERTSKAKHNKKKGQHKTRPLPLYFFFLALPFSGEI